MMNFKTVENRLPAKMFAEAFRQMLEMKSKVMFPPVYPAWNSDEMLALAEDCFKRVVDVALKQRTESAHIVTAFDAALVRYANNAPENTVRSLNPCPSCGTNGTCECSEPK